MSPSPLSNGQFRTPEWHRDIPGTLCSDVGTPGNSGGVLADVDDECPRLQQCSGISHTVPRLPGVRFRVRVSVGCIGLLMMSVKRMMRKRVNVVCEDYIVGERCCAVGVDEVLRLLRQLVRQLAPTACSYASACYSESERWWAHNLLELNTACKTPPRGVRAG